MSNYKIGPEDILDIEVFDVPELKRTVRVSNDGTITLALLGPVQAGGFTLQELRRTLEMKYGEAYVEHPQVSVYVREFHANTVSVIGAVERPGLYQLSGPRTLIEMLSMAGGLGKRSSAPPGRSVFVTRKSGFGETLTYEGLELVAPDKVEINLQRLLYSEQGVLNIEIEPSDVITVSKADIVYVVGAVRKPGGFVLEDRERVTVLQALAMAEGLGTTPAKGSSRIIRRPSDGTPIEIPVNLGKVLAGKAEDLELVANDILFIPDSNTKLAAKRTAEAAIATVTGILIFRRP